MRTPLTYLALGDSYTIGEGLPLYESYPYQVIQLLRNMKFSMTAPEVVARTGWTTADLLAYLDKLRLSPHYDFVSLLIGVNNQYRGQSVARYEDEFTELLQHCVNYAGEKSRVFVLSIPDWGRTPFASGMDNAVISAQVAKFNETNRQISQKACVNYVDITPISASPDDLYEVVGDGLHPSATVYSGWANLMASKLIKLFRDNGQE
jgi:lysophospholipase L1-like esterase